MERALLHPEVEGIMLLRNAGNYFIIEDIKYCKSLNLHLSIPDGIIGILN